MRSRFALGNRMYFPVRQTRPARPIDINVRRVGQQQERHTPPKEKHRSRICARLIRKGANRRACSCRNEAQLNCSAAVWKCDVRSPKDKQAAQINFKKMRPVELRRSSCQQCQGNIKKNSSRISTNTKIL